MSYESYLSLAKHKTMVHRHVSNHFQISTYIRKCFRIYNLPREKHIQFSQSANCPPLEFLLMVINFPAGTTKCSSSTAGLATDSMNNIHIFVGHYFGFLLLVTKWFISMLQSGDGISLFPPHINGLETTCQLGHTVKYPLVI